LLKPIDPDDLINTVKRIEKKKGIPTKEQLSLLLQSMQQSPKTTPQRIALSSGDGLIFIPTSDIVYCEAESNYTTVVLVGGKKVVVSKVLKEIDEALSGPDFFRVHSSFLINLNHIKKFVRVDGGYIVMDNDATINISRSRRQEFMEMFSKF